MRQKRAKTYKRVMALYTQTFGFRTPFQILVSQDILLACPTELSIYKALQSCVQAECKYMITQCCVEALYKLGPEYQSCTNTAKTFERRRCNHREAIDPDECLKDVIGGTNKHNYVLAAQSATLRQKLQNVPGLPIIHFNPRQVAVLSPPSIATTRSKNDIEEKRRLEAEQGLGEVVDGENVIASGSGAGAGASTASAQGLEGIRGRKKTKAPNPLSMRKKKVEKRPREEKDVELEDTANATEAGGGGDGEGTGKRRKKRKRGKGKGVVAEARAELAGMASGAESGSDSE